MTESGDDQFGPSVPTSRRGLLGLIGAGATGSALAGCLEREPEPETDPVSSQPGSAPASTDQDPIGDPAAPPADRAQAAWETVRETVTRTSDEAANRRIAAYVAIERAVREAAVVVPLYHGLTERYWYDRVQIPAGVVPGAGWYQHTQTAVEGQDKLTIVHPPVGSLDPLDWRGPPSGPLAGVYETLTAVPNGSAGTPEPRSRLLEGYRVADDGRTWRLTLAPDRRFQDGRSLTAADVVYSWRRAVEDDPDLIEPWPAGLGVRADRDDDGNLIPESLTQGIRAADDRTVELRLTDPNPDVLATVAQSAFAVLPAGLVDDTTGYDGAVSQDALAAGEGIGTGPLEFEAVDLSRGVRVTRAEHARESAPRVDRIHWQFETSESAWTKILDGTADLFTLPAFARDATALAVESDDRGRRTGSYGPVDLLAEPVQYRAVPAPTTVYLGANAAGVPPAVRRAIAELLDRAALVELVAGGRVPAGSFTPPGVWPADSHGGRDAYARVLADDPYGRTDRRVTAATDRLAAAGISRETPVSLTLGLYRQPALRRLAERLDGLLADRSIGIELTVEETSALELFDRAEAGNLDLWLAGRRWEQTAVGPGLARLVPTNTNTDRMPDTAAGLPLDWHTELNRPG